MKKWTNGYRMRMFQRVYEKFGAFKTWGGSYPKGKKEDFDNLVKDISMDLRENCNLNVTPGAVVNQIHWATTKQTVIKTHGHVSNWVFNKAAAEVGLIEYSDLPEQVMVH